MSSVLIGCRWDSLGAATCSGADMAPICSPALAFARWSLA
jgi:hypothetical protein